MNGPNAAACSGFVPTKHELQQLAKFWIERIFDLDFYWFQTQSTVSSEWRERQFAERRLSRIAEVLGDDLIEALEAEVSNELCDRLGHEQWHLFLQQRQAC